MTSLNRIIDHIPIHGETHSQNSKTLNLEYGKPNYSNSNSLRQFTYFLLRKEPSCFQNSVTSVVPFMPTGCNCCFNTNCCKLSKTFWSQQKVTICENQSDMVLPQYLLSNPRISQVQLIRFGSQVQLISVILNLLSLRHY